MTALHGVLAHLYSVSAAVCRCLPPHLAWKTNLKADFCSVLPIAICLPNCPKGHSLFSSYVTFKWIQKLNSWTYNFVEDLSIILRGLRLKVSLDNLSGTLHTSFKPLLLVEVTVNSKEGNSEDFCPNYVKEFGLRFNKQRYIRLCLHMQFNK